MTEDDELVAFLEWLTQRYPGSFSSYILPSGKIVYGNGMHHSRDLIREFREWQ